MSRLCTVQLSKPLTRMRRDWRSVPFSDWLLFPRACLAPESVDSVHRFFIAATLKNSRLLASTLESYRAARVRMRSAISSRHAAFCRAAAVADAAVWKYARGRGRRPGRDGSSGCGGVREAVPRTRGERDGPRLRGHGPPTCASASWDMSGQAGLPSPTYSRRRMVHAEYVIHICEMARLAVVNCW
jgi:hypothetical protein